MKFINNILKRMNNTENKTGEAILNNVSGIGMPALVENGFTKEAEDAMQTNPVHPESETNNLANGSGGIIDLTGKAVEVKDSFNQTIREYSFEIHGEDFAKLAAQFAAQSTDYSLKFK